MADVKYRFFVEKQLKSVFSMRWPIIVSCTLLISSLTVFGQEPTDNFFNFKWDNGFVLESADQNFLLGFGAQVFIDHAYFFHNIDLDNNYGSLKSKSGMEIRSARLFFEGTIYKNTNFKFQVEFAGEEVSLKDVYIGISDVPGVGNIRVGHFNEPFRLSSLTSGKYLTFMERGANSYFIQKRNNGLMVFNDFIGKHLSSQFGVFRNADNDSNDVLANTGYALTGRVSALPYFDSGNYRLLHIGLGFSYRKPDSKTYKISIPPSSHLAETYIHTGDIPHVRAIDFTNLETAFVFGALSLQAEYLWASVDTREQTYHFSNYYGELSWFLTGEHKNYKGSYEGFGRIKPKRNFGNDKGMGAWEVAVRYSETDLSHQGIFGGKQLEMVFGLNWYLNPATRLMINYAWTEIQNKGSLNLIQGRFQIDF